MYIVKQKLLLKFYVLQIIMSLYASLSSKDSMVFFLS